MLDPDTLSRLVPPRRLDLVAGSSGRIVDQWSLDSHRSVWLVEVASDVLVIPVIHEDNRARRATAGDLFMSHIPQGIHGHFRSTIDIPGSVQVERGIGVDQTNESVILDDRWIAKWQWSARSSQSLAKEILLAEHAFPHTPESRGHLTWRDDVGEDLLLAGVQRYLPDSEDGWTWCVRRAMADDSEGWPAVIAQVVASMHEVLAPANLAHGDLHVGQFLHCEGQYYVIDFDGNPVGNRSESWLGDVVGMLCSFLHVAAVAGKKYGASHDVLAWADRVSEEFLHHYQASRTSVTLPDRRTLLGLMEDSERNELEYAARFLPEWTYAAQFGYDTVKGRANESA